MSRKTLLTLSVSVTLATISLAPTAVFAQFPGPPPMGPGGPPPIAAGGRIFSGDLDGVLHAFALAPR